MRIKLAAAVIFVCTLSVNAQIPGEKDHRTLLPNGWWLSPAGEQIRLGDFPMNAAMTDDEHFLAVSHSGQSKAEIWLLDLTTRQVVQKIRLTDAWYGMKFVGQQLFVSGGYENCVYVYSLGHDRLEATDTVRFAEPHPKFDGAMGGLDVRGDAIATVFRNDSSLRVMDLKTRKQELLHLDGMPYTCLYLDDGSLLVSVWGSRKAEVFKDMKRQYEVPTGDHPNEIALSRDGRYAFVACSGDNTVTVIDLRERKALSSVSTAIHPDAPEGSTTNSVAITPDQHFLLAANADNNSLAMIDIRNPEQPRPAGFIPVGWYPTKVIVLKDGSVLVLNGKGGRSFANPRGEYIARLMEGSMSMFPLPDERKLVEYSRQVFANTPYTHEGLLHASYREKNAVPQNVGDASPIKHILYIIKENRTYDQVLGDMPEGNGDSSLCIFGAKVTPNLHALAREFTLFDNFYVNSEVSADGHNWSMGAYATDYVEKTWPTQYGGRGGEYVFEGSLPIVWPEAGYLWNLAERSHVTVRSYGEFITSNSTVGKPGTPRGEGLEGHFSPSYRGWDLEYSDVDRYKEWEKEFTAFERTGQLPQLCIMHLPNDHTAGTKKGALTPRAYVAQNDYALGLIVERITHSSYWNSTAIFVLEDDAQNGPDHIDAHRSSCLVVSPFTKRKFVDHTLYSTAGMLRTMELILGLPPMSQYDASSMPMFNAFTLQADTESYKAKAPVWDLGERNKPGSYGEMLMEKFDLTKEDAVPDREFNEIVWRSVTDMPMPVPRFSIFSRRENSDGDGDE